MKSHPFLAYHSQAKGYCVAYDTACVTAGIEKETVTNANDEGIDSCIMVSKPRMRAVAIEKISKPQYFFAVWAWSSPTIIADRPILGVMNTVVEISGELPVHPGEIKAFHYDLAIDEENFGQ